MLRLENVATPATAAAVAVPESVPLAGLVPIAMVMLFVAVVTVLPDASCTVTLTAGAIEAPAVVLPGWTVKASLDAVPPGVTVAMLEYGEKSVPVYARTRYE